MQPNLARIVRWLSRRGNRFLSDSSVLNPPAKSGFDSGLALRLEPAAIGAEGLRAEDAIDHDDIRQAVLAAEVAGHRVTSVQRGSFSLDGGIIPPLAEVVEAPGR
jgi:hypothetical protein